MVSFIGVKYSHLLHDVSSLPFTQDTVKYKGLGQEVHADQVDCLSSSPKKGIGMATHPSGSRIICLPGNRVLASNSEKEMDMVEGRGGEGVYWIWIGLDGF